MLFIDNDQNSDDKKNTRYRNINYNKHSKQKWLRVFEREV